MLCALLHKEWESLIYNIVVRESENFDRKKTFFNNVGF